MVKKKHTINSYHTTKIGINMKTTNEFKEEKIKELEDKRTKLQNELKAFEEYVEEHTEEIAERTAKIAELAPTIKKINEQKDRNKAATLELVSKRISPNSPKFKRIENDDVFNHIELECPFDEGIQRIRNQIIKANENIEKWKNMPPKEIAKSDEFNAMNNSIIN